MPIYKEGTIGPTVLKCGFGEPSKRAEFNAMAVCGGMVLVRIDNEVAWISREEIAALAVLFPVIRKEPGEIP